MYNTPMFNRKGQPVCEICQVGYDRLLLHVNKRHGLTAAEYKAKFNFHPKKGIQSHWLEAKMRRIANKNYDSVIMPNLIIGGIKTRFKDGNTATDKELVSKIASKTMKAYWDGKRESQEDVIARLVKKLSAIKRNIHATN
ncbi:hypothetical protein [Zobellia roscoffensis]|uniref:hypothetical protein n=1 Tax=Zobellia roscoffensis TaxID=2779508 RepID=UPI00188AB38F|nr:hypothetical protein [Zobellia roscoffensis]